MKKILIFCGPGIGDFIIVLPMAMELKKRNPNSYIKIITASKTSRFNIIRELLRFQDYIDDGDCYSFGEKGHLTSFVLGMGIKRYDEGYVLQYTSNEKTSSWPGRIVKFFSKTTYGIALPNRDYYYTYNFHRNEGLSILDYSKQFLGMENDFDKSLLLLNKDSIISFTKDRISERKDNQIAIVVGTAKVNCNGKGYYLKNWDSQKWILLARMLVKDGYSIALLGGKEEKIECKDEGIKDYIGELSIIESVGVIANSILTIGSDTGLMHCSGALGIPALTLFGCTDYKEYLPYGNHSYYITSKEKCSPCFGTTKMGKECKFSANCMNSITVDEVYKRTLEIIRGGEI